MKKKANETKLGWIFKRFTNKWPLKTSKTEKIRGLKTEKKKTSRPKKLMLTFDHIWKFVDQIRPWNLGMLTQESLFFKWQHTQKQQHPTAMVGSPMWFKGIKEIPKIPRSHGRVFQLLWASPEGQCWDPKCGSASHVPWSKLSRFVGDGHPTFNDGILIMGPYKPLLLGWFFPSPII